MFFIAPFVSFAAQRSPRLPRVLAAAALALFATLACGEPAPVVKLTPDEPSVALAGRSQFWVDRGERLGVAEVEERQQHLPFATRPSDHKVVMSDGDALWIRFVARAQGHETHWLLDVDLPGVDDVTLYFRDAQGQWVVQRAGDSRPQSVWPQRGRQPFMSLSHDADREVAYFVRIQHKRVPFSGGLYLKTPVVMAEQEQRAQFLLGAYFGLAALAILVASANALVYRDRGFGTYVAYITAMALGQAGITGVGGMLLWPEWPRLNNPMTFFVPMLAGATGVWFVRAIATPRQYSTLLDRLAVGFILALLLIAGVDVFVPTDAGFVLSMNLLTASMLLVMLLLALAIARGDRHSRWVAAGFLLVIIGSSFPVARNVGLMNSGFLTEYGMMLGSALEMPLLFYGLHRRLTEQTESRARARALSVTDPLTGLGSQRKLLTQLQASLARLKPGRQAALVLIELANHAALSREHGREAADRALVLAAARLRNVVRDIDTLARVGDQHFALLMDSPCAVDEVNAAATRAVALGLRPSSSLPPGAHLRFHVTHTMLPLPGVDADGTLQRLQQSLRDIAPDARKTIRALEA
ncbi:MAG: diguanylate cyclase [Ramlibacter sp.]|nr:diguanylate cyclase [Ramlibacter sp.]